ncbi:MAG: Abi family protein, partial [Muribaculaceae bacterium]|nr:Abi family protein [Muribaculaceae bacterium]
MKISELEDIISYDRLHRYLEACNGNTSKAVVLYRANINVSLQMFAIVGAFEVALRNAINTAMTEKYGSDWLRDAILPGGIFDVPQCRDHARIIRSSYEKLIRQKNYTHTHLLSKMEFGVWKYLFSSPQYRATGRILLGIFTNRPSSSRYVQYNNTFIFNELDHVNSLRNRIAHHEPICFSTGLANITTDYIADSYPHLRANETLINLVCSL